MAISLSSGGSFIADATRCWGPE